MKDAEPGEDRISRRTLRERADANHLRGDWIQEHCTNAMKFGRSSLPQRRSNYAVGVVDDLDALNRQAWKGPPCFPGQGLERGECTIVRHESGFFRACEEAA